LPEAAATTLLVSLNRARQALELARRFVESGELQRLDEALGLARLSHQEQASVVEQYPELAESLRPHLERSSDLTEKWSTSVQRHRGVSRATFRCLQCGWELTYAAETDAAQPLEIPFEQLDCPVCYPEAPHSSSDEPDDAGSPQNEYPH
jgi:hypothetical protein